MHPRHRLIAVVVLAPACTFHEGLAPPPDAVPADTPAADAPPVPCEPWMWNPSNVGACAAGATIGGPFEVTGGTYDTSTGIYTPANGPATKPPSALVMQPAGGSRARVLPVTALNVPAGATLLVTGSYPLILLVHGNATITGAIDVSARSTTAGGPGAGVLCGQSLGGTGGNGEDPGDGGGGGGGGGFGRQGGQGGAANNGGSSGGGGTASTDTDLEPLRGGCAGGLGGNPNGGTGAGMGGAAGGALQLSVRDTLVEGGALRASGAGGQGGTAGEAGGGGGGSGGALLVEAGAIDIRASAKLCANGGSGGEGASPLLNASGVLGLCADAAATTTGLAVLGGDGGPGGHRGSNSGDGGSGSSSESGGGGGGGVGRIRIIDSAHDGDGTAQIDPQAVISPGES